MSKPTLGANEKVVHTFDMYYCGWDCDETSWVVENIKTGARRCVGTNHGGECQMTVAELGGFLSEYKKAIRETKKAIHLLQGVGNEG